MDKEKLMDLLRNPQKYQKQKTKAGQEKQEAAQQPKTQPNYKVSVVFGGITALVLLSLIFVLSAQKRADNITSSLDPNVLKNLQVNQVFNPNTGRRFIQISEGQERSVSVVQLGSTLPVISRNNYRALTPKNYRIIGEAPWALSINVSSNIDDPDLLRFLFNQKETTDAFVSRADVAPLLADPAALAKAAQDQKVLNDFFAESAVQQVLASPELLNALAGSRLFSTLLISKAVKYYRDHPAEAAKLINSSPALAALKKNPNVRKAVQKNTYLKKIAPVLLK